MYVDGQTIITVGGIITALGIIIGLILKVHKWYLRLVQLEEEVARIKKEDRMLCKGLAACLDGLEQLGANSIVSKTKAELNDHINNNAHE